MAGSAILKALGKARKAMKAKSDFSNWSYDKELNEQFAKEFDSLSKTDGVEGVKRLVMKYEKMGASGITDTEARDKLAREVGYKYGPDAEEAIYDWIRSY